MGRWSAPSCSDQWPVLTAADQFIALYLFVLWKRESEERLVSNSDQSASGPAAEHGSHGTVLKSSPSSPFTHNCAVSLCGVTPARMHLRSVFINLLLVCRLPCCSSFSVITSDFMSSYVEAGRQKELYDGMHIHCLQLFSASKISIKVHPAKGWAVPHCYLSVKVYNESQEADTIATGGLSPPHC